MSRKWKYFVNKKPMYILVSLIFSLILFIYATSVNYSNTTSNNSNSVSETYTNTAEDVPINVTYDSDKYFISGYTSSVTVYLTGSDRVKLAQESNESTRKFTVVADLSHAKVGVDKVPLQVKNLPNGITTQISPSTINVTVGKKKTKTFAVKGSINKSQIGDNVTIKSITTSLSKVTVTSDTDTIKSIDHVEAAFPSDKVLSADYEKSVALQAVSKDGTVLPAVISPANSKLTIKVDDKKS